MKNLKLKRVDSAVVDKKTKEIKPYVLFSEEPHKYYLMPEMKELSGITSIIGKYICPDKYKGVDSATLNRAASRGSEIHKELEEFFHGVSVDNPHDESYACIKLLKKNKIKQIASEFTVTDNELVATNIDAVCQLSGGDVALLDYKTTAVIDKEYLSWQLSLEAKMFEEQCGYAVGKLYAVWMPKPKDGEDAKAELVEVKRIANEHLNALLEAYRTNADTFDNPLKVSNESIDALIDDYLKNKKIVDDLKLQMKEAEDAQKQTAELIKQLMDSNEQTKVDNGKVIVTRKADSIRKTFNLDVFKQNCPDCPAKWITAIEEKGFKESKVAGSITIKVKDAA